MSVHWGKKNKHHSQNLSGTFEGEASPPHWIEPCMHEALALRRGGGGGGGGGGEVLLLGQIGMGVHGDMELATSLMQT